MQNINLRLGTVDDVQNYIALEKSSMGLKTYSTITDEGAVREEFKKNQIYFAEKNGEVVGSCGYEMKSADHAYISSLIVNPKFQGQGVGREILSQIMDKLKDIKRVDLFTHPQNSRAVSLYMSLGFVIESWKDNYFGDGEPRIMMARVI